MNPLGVNLSFAVKRWPEAEAWAAIVRTKLNLDLVQLSFDLLDPWWPSRLLSTMTRRTRRAAAGYGVRIHSAFAGIGAYTYNQLLHPEAEGRAAALVWHRRAIELAAALGAESVGGPLGGMSVRETDPEGRYRGLVEAVRGLADYAGQLGLASLLVEPTPLKREVLWTPEAVRIFLSDLGQTRVPVRICLDVGHALYKPLYGAGAGLAHWLGVLRKSIAVIHIQQTDGQSDSHWSFTRQGLVDPASLAKDLSIAGLDTIPVFLEIFHPFELDDDAALADLVAGVQELKKVFKAD